MSAITSTPYRLLMQDLGAGGTVVSDFMPRNQLQAEDFAHAEISPQESMWGFSFWRRSEARRKRTACRAPQSTQIYRHQYGSLVRKVVTKERARRCFSARKIGFSFHHPQGNHPASDGKIRTGWMSNPSMLLKSRTLPTAKVLSLSHSRTSTQQYVGANWNVIEQAAASPLPIIGNGGCTLQKKL